MRKRLISVVVLTTALLLGLAGPGFAGGSGARPQGRHGAVHPRGARHPGHRGYTRGAPHPTRHGGFHVPGVAPHRPPDHHRFHGHHEVPTRVFIGSGFWWGLPWWWGPAYPYYPTPSAVLQEAPIVYIHQDPAPQEPYYFYYCPNPAGYYPYIKDCPPGWMTVLPPADPLTTPSAGGGRAVEAESLPESPSTMK